VYGLNKQLAINKTITLNINNFHRRILILSLLPHPHLLIFYGYIGATLKLFSYRGIPWYREYRP